MKNKYIQNAKRKAKLLHKTNSRNRHYKDGVLIRHLYFQLDPERLSWWDDFGFVLNDYKVSVAWIHPRKQYSDEVEDLAHSIALKKFPYDESDFEKPKVKILRGFKPNFKKVGKSRKKISSYTMDLNRSDIDNKRKEEWNRLEESLFFDSDIEIKPSISTKWTDHSRFVAVCIPLEIRNEEDLKKLASIVKQLLKRETTLDILFPNYSYTKEDWIAEQSMRIPNDLHSHALA